MKPIVTNPLLLLLTGALVACGGNSPTSTANEKPLVSVKRADGSKVTAQTYLGANERLVINSSDPDGSISKVRWVIDGGKSGEKSGEFVGSEVKSRLELILPNLGGGTHTLDVTATDDKGASNSFESAFNVDATQPTLSRLTLNGKDLPSGTSLNLLLTDAAALEILATDRRSDSDPNPLPAKIQLYENGSLIASGSGTLNADLAKVGGKARSATGTSSFKLVVADDVGNQVSSSFTINFTAAGEVDTTKPTFTWLTPAGEFVPGNGNTVTLRATATRNDTDLSSGITYSATCGQVAGNIWTLDSTCTDGSKQVVTATVSVNGKAYSDTRTVTVDASAPTVQITSPEPGSTITSNPVKVSLSATDAVSGVASILLEASRDGGAYEQVGVLTSSSGEITWAPTNGTYTLRATATDRTGLKSSTTISNLKVQLTSSDKTPPVVSEVKVLNAAAVLRGTITVQATATDADSGVAKVELFDGGNSLGVQTSSVGNAYTFAVDTTKLSDGAHTLRAVATDNVGLRHEKTLEIQVDNTAPVLTWDVPNIVGATGTLTLTATSNEESRITYSAPCGTITGNVWDYRSCPDGTTATLTATATDPAGNTTVQTRTVTIDLTAPTVQITSPQDGQKFTQNPITINVSGTDNQAVDHIDVFSNNKQIGTVSGAQGSVTWAPASGSYTITAKAYDKAGNASGEARAQISVELTTTSAIIPTAAPTLTASKTAASNPTFVRGVGTLTGSATADRATVASAQLIVDGQPNGTPTASSGSVSFNFDFDTLNEGLHDLSLRWTNSAGVSADSDKLSVYVDKTAPVVKWNIPANGSVTNTAPLKLEATATDAASGLADIAYSVNGQTVTSPWQPSGEGAFTVTATATDKVGNAASQNTTVTYDKTGPVITPTSPTNSQEFSAAPITISASATDNLTGVASMEAFVTAPNEQPISLGRQQGSNYSAQYTPVKSGTYTVTFQALDGAGNAAQVATRSFTYSAVTEENPKPVIEVVGSGPFSKNMSVKVSGGFDSRSQIDRLILQVTDSKDFRDNTTYVTTQDNAAFSVDTTRFANGELTLTAIAYTKSDLRGEYSKKVTVQNILNPILSVAAPTNGATVNTPTVPVRVTLTQNGDTPFNFPPQKDGPNKEDAKVTVELLDYRGESLGTQIVPCSGSVDKATYTCDTSFDMAGMPADTYTIRATAQVEVTGATSNPQTLRTESKFTSNTSSVNPPASVIRFPAAITQSDTRKVARIDSGSGFFATVSDNTAVQYVEARIVGPYNDGNIASNGTQQCQASGSTVGSPVNVLLLNVPGAGLPPYQAQDVFVPSLDIDGSTYVPNSLPDQRYDLRVTVADSEGNRNIQCVPVRIERGLTRPDYQQGSTKTANPAPGELNPSSGRWYLDNVPANSRVVAVFYANGKQVGTSFIANTDGKRIEVSQSFADVGTYQVKWLIEDMDGLSKSAGVVTSKEGDYIEVARNPK
ncbi:Ig-like domain-containing protein [Deinococcus geothermalis]|uniref:Ig-like domain-containing protein n=1 Tax=Deinococcus geothermalis TaxID=68909 RepID=UPI00235771BA|nr:Ig-like domain-containing protein [Deinococcus geothermalis]